MVMCIQRKIFVMDWKIPPSSLKQNAIPAPRGFAPRVWNLHFAFVIRVEFFNPSLKFSLDSLNSKSDCLYKYSSTTHPEGKTISINFSYKMGSWSRITEINPKNQSANLSRFESR